MKTLIFSFSFLVLLSCRSSKAGCDAYGKVEIENGIEYVQIATEYGDLITEKVPVMREKELHLNLPPGEYTIYMYSDGKVSAKKVRL